jgi:2-C-methyl-D-erythritol 4-phosphate cytidylyltransferase/2-C-methyl-D-erythritol 2,4-cyclodiphosphate synthase
LILGGIEIPYERGLLGHSDADVVTHAAMDAALGAAGCADIGTYFPDDDEAYKDADSMKLAERVHHILLEASYRLEGLDIMVVAEAPKLKPYVPQMKERLCAAFRLTPEQLGLKATTNEKMGWVGRGEGIACLASALVRKTL